MRLQRKGEAKACCPIARVVPKAVPVPRTRGVQVQGHVASLTPETGRFCQWKGLQVRRAAGAGQRPGLVIGKGERVRKAVHEQGH